MPLNWKHKCQLIDTLACLQLILYYQAEKMLKKYFDSKDDVAETLLKADQSLTVAAKEIEGENC